MQNVFRLAVLAAMILPATLRADDDAARKVKVALALAHAEPVPVTKAADCGCETTGVCKCDPRTCPCCEKGLPRFAAVKADARKKNLPVVCYVGCKGRCVDGAICSAEPIGVYKAAVVEIVVANGERWTVVAELPPASTPQAVQDAVKKATAPPAPKVLPKAVAPVPAPLNWYSIAPRQMVYPQACQT